GPCWVKDPFHFGVGEGLIGRGNALGEVIEVEGKLPPAVVISQRDGVDAYLPHRFLLFSTNSAFLDTNRNSARPSKSAPPPNQLMSLCLVTSTISANIKQVGDARHGDRPGGGHPTR